MADEGAITPVRFYTATSMSFEVDGQRLEVTKEPVGSQHITLLYLGDDVPIEQLAKAVVAMMPKPRTSWQRLLEEPIL